MSGTYNNTDNFEINHGARARSTSLPGLRSRATFQATLEARKASRPTTDSKVRAKARERFDFNTIVAREKDRSHAAQQTATEINKRQQEIARMVKDLSGRSYSVSQRVKQQKALEEQEKEDKKRLEEAAKMPKPKKKEPVQLAENHRLRREGIRSSSASRAVDGKLSSRIIDFYATFFNSQGKGVEKVYNSRQASPEAVRTTTRRTEERGRTQSDRGADERGRSKTREVKAKPKLKPKPTKKAEPKPENADVTGALALNLPQRQPKVEVKPQSDNYTNVTLGGLNSFYVAGALPTGSVRRLYVKPLLAPTQPTAQRKKVKFMVGEDENSSSDDDDSELVTRGRPLPPRPPQPLESSLSDTDRSYTSSLSFDPYVYQSESSVLPELYLSSATKLEKATREVAELERQLGIRDKAPDKVPSPRQIPKIHSQQYKELSEESNETPSFTINSKFIKSGLAGLKIPDARDAVAPVRSRGLHRRESNPEDSETKPVKTYRFHKSKF